MLESQATSGDGGTDADPRLAALWTALATVIDPEIGLDLVTLGLVYGVEIDGDVAHITHTLTTPGCPMEHYITNGIREATAQVAGLDRVETNLVWDPAWHTGMIAPGAL
ncbi:MAG: metal-sulfur cluster assembly factor [Gemmatimonadaceae bacterium]